MRKKLEKSFLKNSWLRISVFGRLLGTFLVKMEEVQEVDLHGKWLVFS